MKAIAAAILALWVFSLVPAYLCTDGCDDVCMTASAAGHAPRSGCGHDDDGDCNHACTGSCHAPMLIAGMDISRVIDSFMLDTPASSPHIPQVFLETFVPPDNIA